jgi:hypothetical protein
MMAGSAGVLPLRSPIYLVVELSIRCAISEQSPKSRREGAQIMGHLYS